MAKYTLEAHLDHKFPAHKLVPQTIEFVRHARKKGLLGGSSLKDSLEDFKTMRRWPSPDTSQLANAARKVPNKVALIDDSGQLTYAELLEMAQRFATGMIQRNYGAGKNVAVMALNGRGIIVPMLAYAMAGYNIFLMNVNSSPRQLEAILDFHDIDLLITDEEFYETFEDSTKARPIIFSHLDSAKAPDGHETIFEVIQSIPVAGISLPEKPTKSVRVIMTSGTTGMPKGVIRLQRKLPVMGLPSIKNLPLQPERTWLLTAVLFHQYGWGYMCMAFGLQSTVITHRHFSAEQVYADMQKYGVNVWVTAASRIRALFKYLEIEDITQVPGLDMVISSGSPLLPTEVEQVTEVFGPVLFNHYGSSESSAEAVSGPRELARDPRLTGHIPTGVTIEIRDEEGNALADGEIGQVWVHTYDMFGGYTDPSIKIPMHDNFYFMGDRGYKFQDRLYVLGRADDLVITQFGEKIQPSEIIDTLVQSDDIDDAFVCGVADSDTGQALRAWVVPSVGSNLSADEVREFVTSRLSSAHRPRDVFFVAALPMTPTGKVIKRELPEHDTI